MPAHALGRPLALTLGTLQGAYEVFVNGQQIGATASPRSLADLRIPRPFTFDVPPGVWRPMGPQTIALRLRSQIFMHPHWRLRDEGPYLLTESASAPRAAGRQQLESQWVRTAPHLVFGAVFGVVGLLSLMAWLGEKQRWELWWFAWSCLAWSFAGVHRILALLSDGYPLNSEGVAWEFVYGNLQLPLMVAFVFAVLDIRWRPARWALWLGWSLAPLSLLTNRHEAVWWIGVPAFLWVALVGMAAVVWHWWRLAPQHRLSPERRILYGVLLFATLNRVWVWLVFNQNNFATAANKSSTRAASDVPHFMLGPYMLHFGDLFWLLVVAVILALLLRGVAADRQERHRLAGELEAARLVQRLLLVEPSSAPGPFRVEAVYRPALEVGGDFYWTRQDEDGALLVLLGDVSGKGLKAAMLVSVVVGLLRNERSCEPSAVLAALNDGLAGHTGGGFVTCCCARFDLDGRVTIGNAGHPSPYGDGREVEVEAGLPLGVVAGVAYEESVVRGERFTFVSDGVVEAENSRRELFGFDRTREISTKSAQEIADAAKAWGQNDDITVVTVRRKA